jgi:nicotinate-nucleotide adenylyltransferase
LGGAFNPPHIGHLVLAQEAASQFRLERVLLVPYGRAPHKPIDPEPGPEQRLEMTRLAAGDDDLLEVSPIEVEREGSSYTFRTLELLRDLRPEDELTFLMGADVAAHLDDWREPARVVELARLGVAGRPGSVLEQAWAVLDRLGARARADVVEMPEIGVSSTWVRRRVAERRPIRHLVPDAVAALIAERGLYRETVTA